MSSSAPQPTSASAPSETMAPSSPALDSSNSLSENLCARCAGTLTCLCCKIPDPDVNSRDFVEEVVADILAEKMVSDIYFYMIGSQS